MNRDPAQSLATALGASGARITRQRRVVLDVLDHAPAHLNAREVLRRAREADPGIDRATVYRTLLLLKRAGLIDELDLLHMEGEQHYYERRGESDHVHICCVACGRVEELDTHLVADLIVTIRQTTGFEADSVRIEVKARCPDCISPPA
jgi:Fur family ferric uptake transcriptional regulator